MLIENMVKSLEAVQEQMNTIAFDTTEDAKIYIIAKAVAELAFIVRRYIIERGFTNGVNVHEGS